MRKPRTLLKLFFAVATSLAYLTSCAGSGENSPELSDKYGNPVTIDIDQVDHIEEPEDFASRKHFVDERNDEKKKFIFDAKPGENIVIVNPSDRAISAEEVESSVRVKDGYADDEDDAPQPEGPRMAYRPASQRSFTLRDPQTKKVLRTLDPKARAEISLEEPTQGGDLTVYEKDENSPLNFESRSPSVNQLLVATERPDVDNFDPNTDFKALLLSDVVDFGDLYTNPDGYFVYKERLNLREGDQFYIGETRKFDTSSTFYSFLSEEPVEGGSKVHFTAPDYALCYNAFDVHQQETPVDFDDPEAAQLTMPSEEQILREIDADGGLLDVYEDKILPEMILDNEELCEKLQIKKAKLGLSTTLSFERLTISVSISFNTEGPTLITSWSLTVSGKVQNLDASPKIGSAWVRGGISMYFKKTMSTYSDFSIDVLPYPRLRYVVAMKSVDEYSVTWSVGIAASMQQYTVDGDKKQQEADLKEIFGGDPKPVEGQPEPDTVVIDGGAGGGDNPGGDEPGGDGPGALERIKRLGVGPKGEYKNPDDDKGKYDKFKNAGKGKYSGDGIVISGPGVNLTFTYVTLEIGVSLFFSPTIEGRVYATYSKVSETVLCQVAKGFDKPDGYSDDVEYSHSYWTIGCYCKFAMEAGLMVEVLLYPTGLRGVFRFVGSFSFGLYFEIKGVAMIYWGTDADFSMMGYISIEFGVFLRFNLRIIALNGKIIVDFKGWEFKYPLLAFGTNLHFLDWVGDRDEIDYAATKYININDLGILNLIYYSADSLNVFRSSFDWRHKEYFMSAAVKFKLRLFSALDILEGKEYVRFNDQLSCFEVKDGAPKMFDFKFRVTVNRWLGIACGSKTFTVHFASSTLRFIGFEGYDQQPKEVDGVHLGGGKLEQGEIYEAPNMPEKDGMPFFGWLGNNGLFLRAGERMTVGSHGITFTPQYRKPVTYAINFYDGANRMVSSQNIAPGGNAVEPEPGVRDARMGEKKFLFFDHDFNDVYGNFNTYGLYAEGDVGNIPSFAKSGTNIKTIYFDHVPEGAIAAKDVDASGMSLRVEYSDKTDAEIPVDASWLSNLSSGTHELGLTFRGRTTWLTLDIA